MSGRTKRFVTHCEVVPGDTLRVVPIDKGLTFLTDAIGGSGVHIERAELKRLHAYLGRYLERTEKGAKR